MAYSTISNPIGGYIYDGEQALGSQWEPALNNNTEEDTKEEKKGEEPAKGESEEKSEEDEAAKSSKDSDDEYNRTPFYRTSDQASFISTLGTTHLSPSPSESSGESDVFRDMKGHSRQTDLSGPVNTLGWRESSGQLPTTEESSDSDFSLIRTDSGTSGELFSSYSTSPDSSLLVGATDASPTYNATSPPVDTSSWSPFENPGSYEADTYNYPSAGSTYGGSSTLGGSPAYRAYSTYQLGGSSNLAPIGSIDMSAVYPYEDSPNTKSPYSYGDLSSSTYESSTSYPYGGTSDSAHGTSWEFNHPS